MACRFCLGCVRRISIVCESDGLGSVFCGGGGSAGMSLSGRSIGGCLPNRMSDDVCHACCVLGSGGAALVRKRESVDCVSWYWCSGEGCVYLDGSDASSGSGESCRRGCHGALGAGIDGIHGQVLRSCSILCFQKLLSCAVVFCLGL